MFILLFGPFQLLLTIHAIRHLPNDLKPTFLLLADPVTKSALGSHPHFLWNNGVSQPKSPSQQPLLHPLHRHPDPAIQVEIQVDKIIAQERATSLQPVVSNASIRSQHVKHPDLLQQTAILQVGFLRGRRLVKVHVAGAKLVTPVPNQEHLDVSFLTYLLQTRY